MFSLWSLRFTIVMLANFVSEDDAPCKLMVFGAFNLITAMSCGVAGAAVTITLKLQLFVLPDVSVAVQSTALVPKPNIEPGGGRQFNTTPAQLSLIVGAA